MQTVDEMQASSTSPGIMMLSETAKKSVKRVVTRIATSSLLRPCGPPLLRAVQYTLSIHHREVVNLSQPQRAEAAARIREIVTAWSTQTVGVDEAYMIRSAILATAKIDGDIAEVGVFRGGTARVICETKGNRCLHLFDTFEGLPEPSEVDSAFRKGQYACSLETVRNYLGGFPDVQFYKGYFPATAKPVKDRCFSFVHLDVDLHESTLQALEFFYPRMDPGAIIISHDYVEFPGVRGAFDGFFEHKPEPVIELTGNQCLVVKVACRPGP
jgi:O-methyltransferase